MLFIGNANHLYVTSKIDFLLVNKIVKNKFLLSKKSRPKKEGS